MKLTKKHGIQYVDVMCRNMLTNLINDLQVAYNPSRLMETEMEANDYSEQLSAEINYGLQVISGRPISRLKG